MKCPECGNKSVLVVETREIYTQRFEGSEALYKIVGLNSIGKFVCYRCFECDYEWEKGA